MNETSTDNLDAVETVSERIPNGAHETFLVLGGLVFAAFAAFVWAYAAHGERLTRELDALCAEAAFQSGHKLEGRGSGSYDAAILRYRQAMEGRFASNERRYDCGRAIGDLLMRQQRFAEAIAAYESLPPQAFQQAGAYTGWVKSLWREGRFEEAQQNAQRWLRLAELEENTEQQVWAHRELMRAAEENGGLEDALEHGEAMLSLAPEGDAHMQLVRVLKRMARYAEAKGHLEAYLETGGNPILREEAERVLPEMTRLAAEKK